MRIRCHTCRLNRTATEPSHVSILEFATFLRVSVDRSVCATLAAVSVGGQAFRPRNYTPPRLFAPQTVARIAGLAGLAAQFGVAPAGPRSH